MRVCIPAKSKTGRDVEIHRHFGTAPYFAIYDSETDDLEFAPNQNPHKGQGGCNPPEKIGRSDFDSILCHSMGKNALAMFNERNITVFQANNNIISGVIELIKAGTILPITPSVGCKDESASDSCGTQSEGCEQSDCAGSGTDCGDGSCQPPESFEV
ncbi:MAG: NifB/NifX family molybdenum-iron cluster-binding protein [candidate division Zixibacteria bacterium]|nr:NifB/NifX family molybdenum-iron cluster-binding protein [candidate division Zixibacteria bacterium]